MTKAQMHIGGRHVWEAPVSAEPDPRQPGRALVRVQGNVAITSFVTERDGESVGAFYVNGHLVSSRPVPVEAHWTEPQPSALLIASVDIETTLLVDEASLAPILSSSFGTAALEALLDALPRCVACVREHAADPAAHSGAYPLLARRLFDGEPYCAAHGPMGSKAIPYAPVVEAIEARLRSTGGWPRALAGDAAPTESR